MYEGRAIVVIKYEVLATRVRIGVLVSVNSLLLNLRESDEFVMSPSVLGDKRQG